MSREAQDRILEAISFISLILYFVLWFTLKDVPSEPVLAVIAPVLLGLGILLAVLSVYTLRARGTKELIDTGVYGIVRHPLYVGAGLMFFSMMFFIPHWLVVIDAIVGMASVYGIILSGDHRNIEKFGDVYRDYMQAVPQINFVAGVIRQLQNRRGK